MDSFMARRARVKEKGINGNGMGIPLDMMAQMASWPTPVKEDARSSARHGYMKTGNAGTTLLDAARMTNWPTPKASDSIRGARMRRGDLDELTQKQAGKDLPTTVAMSNWPTPQSRDGQNSRSGMPERTGGRQRNLDDYVTLAPWATPATRDYKGANSTDHITTNGTGRMHMDQLANQVVHWTSGQDASGSPAPTAKRAQLAPAFSLWLMGYPPAVNDCAPPAMRSSRKSRPNGSRQ